MNKYLYLLSAILIVSLSSCLSTGNEEKLKKENDSLKDQLKKAEIEINSLKDSVYMFLTDSSYNYNPQTIYTRNVNFDDPQEVAKAFIKALNEEDFAAARELGTKNTAKMFGIIESLANLADDDEDIDIDNSKDVTWGETIIKGKSAVCYYSTPNDPNQKIDLLLVNGQWKVDFKKED